MGAFKVFVDIVYGFFGSRSANFRARTSTKAGGRFQAELNAVFRLGSVKRLGISIRDNKLDTLQVGIDHVVYGVTTSTTDTEYDYPGLEFLSHSMRLYQSTEGVSETKTARLKLKDS